jgi:hypothetical protein
VRSPLSIPGGYRADLGVPPKAPLLPFLVPQVDADDNEIGGIQLSDVAVRLATYTGWNFRNPSVGQPGELSPLIGSYILLPVTREAAEQVESVEALGSVGFANHLWARPEHLRRPPPAVLREARCVRRPYASKRTAGSSAVEGTLSAGVLGQRGLSLNLGERRAAGDLIPARKRCSNYCLNVLAQQIVLLNKLLSSVSYQRLITRAAAIADGNREARIMT